MQSCERRLPHIQHEHSARRPCMQSLWQRHNRRMQLCRIAMPRSRPRWRRFVLGKLCRFLTACTTCQAGVEITPGFLEIEGLTSPTSPTITAPTATRPTTSETFPRSARHLHPELPPTTFQLQPHPTRPHTRSAQHKLTKPDLPTSPHPKPMSKPHQPPTTQCHHSLRTTASAAVRGRMQRSHECSTTKLLSLLMSCAHA